jgi:very-short-patch-repair endonuclease
MVDSALALGDLDVERLEALLGSGRPGVRALRKAFEASDRKAESAGATVLRLFHLALEIAVESQVDLYGPDGAFVCRADLLVVGTREVHEYDGAGHRGKDRHRADLRRERRLAGASYRRRGFTLDDLVNHPGVAMHEIDAALHRAHEPERLRGWRRMIEGSLYSEAGRSRVLNRWRREMGVVDWR